MENFNPRAPCGGATLASVPDDAQGGISIHAPRAGARHKQRARKAWAKLFQSTRPVRGRDQIKQGAARYVDISIHAPRAGARQIGFPVFLSTDTFQSTRPVRGRDIEGAPAPSCFFYFNPRAPCGGATQHNQPNSQPGKFQSTRPVRGRDPMAQAHIKILHISIHAPRAGARRHDLGQLGQQQRISIHAPRAGARPFRVFLVSVVKHISIHAPRAGARRSDPGYRRRPERISIHAPRAGARHGVISYNPASAVFQSTRPVRGRDSSATRLLASIYISIHAPRAGARHCRHHRHADDHEFQSTRPVRGRDVMAANIMSPGIDFNPRAPCGGATFLAVSHCPTCCYFNPRAPCGGATAQFLCSASRKE